MAVDRKIQDKNAEHRQTTEWVNRGFNKRLYFNTGMRRCIHGCEHVGSYIDVGVHEKSCQSRKVPCVIEDCNDAVPLNELIDHIETVGTFECPRHWDLRIVECSDNSVETSWGGGKLNKKFKNLNRTWDHVFYYIYSGHKFFPRVVKRNNIYNVNTKIMANEEAANQFKVDLELGNKKNLASIKLPGMKVYSVDTKHQDILEKEEGVMSFGQNMAEKLFQWEDDKSSSFLIKCTTTRKQNSSSLYNLTTAILSTARLVH